jgi:hypothetical protein
MIQHGHDQLSLWHDPSYFVAPAMEGTQSPSMIPINPFANDNLGDGVAPMVS